MEYPQEPQLRTQDIYSKFIILRLSWSMLYAGGIVDHSRSDGIECELNISESIQELDCILPGPHCSLCTSVIVGPFLPAIVLVTPFCIMGIRYFLVLVGVSFDGLELPTLALIPSGDSVA